MLYDKVICSVDKAGQYTEFLIFLTLTEVLRKNEEINLLLPDTPFFWTVGKVCCSLWSKLSDKGSSKCSLNFLLQV